jgi:GxxExxY protein
MKDFKYKDNTKEIFGACMKVYSTPGTGFQEMKYLRTFTLQTEADSVGFQREANMPIYFLDAEVGERSAVCFIVGKICFELKTITKLGRIHFTHLRNYLEVFSKKVGLLINFVAVGLDFRRLENPKYNPFLISSLKPSFLAQKPI